MRAVGEACAELADLLVGAGFSSASIDPEQLNMPGAVWIQPRSIGGRTLGGAATLTVWAYLIAPSVDVADTVSLLDDSLAGVLDLDVALTPDDPIDLTAAVLLPGYTTPLPAYRVALDLDL